MSLAPSNRTERKKAQTRQNLVESAKKLFSKHGFAGTTIDDIANHADVAKVTFYYHFKSKEELALEIRRQCVEEATNYVEEQRQKDLPVEEMIQDFVNEVANWTEENWKLLEVFCAQRLNPLMSFERGEDEKPEPMIMCIDAILQKGQQSGRLRKDFDRLQVARLIDLGIMCEQNEWIRAGRKRGTLRSELMTCFSIVLEGVQVR